MQHEEETVVQGKVAHILTPQERREVDMAFQEYQRVVAFVARLHDLSNVSLSLDRQTFVHME